MEPRRVLLVEDDTRLAAHTAEYLQDHDFRVEIAADGELGLARALSGEHDVVLLDLMLPRLDGLAVCKALRQRSAVPVLMLSARSEEIDRILGLELGADDYLAKPFDLDELEARVRALARRSTAAGADSPLADGPAFGGLRLAADSGAVYHQGQPLELAPREGALLRALLARPGQALAKERLSELVFAGEAEVQPDAIEVVAYRLRKKLAATGARLVTLRGLGYLLQADG